MNTELINILSKLKTITDKVILKYPITTINSEAKDILVNIDTKKLGCSEFADTGVYELGKFISMFNLLKNPEIKRENNCLIFKTSENTAVFTLSDIDVMTDYNLSEKFITNLANYDDSATLSITAEEISRFKQASSIFSELNVVDIIGDVKTNTCILKLDAHNRFNHSNNTFKTESLGNSSRDFNLKISVENFNKLPTQDYTIRIKYNSEKDAYRILFESEFFSILVSRVSES